MTATRMQVRADEDGASEDMSAHSKLPLLFVQLIQFLRQFLTALNMCLTLSIQFEL
jgi:hypothetical protein